MSELCFKCGHPPLGHFNGHSICHHEDCKCSFFQTRGQAEADAMFAVDLHVIKGTMLSDDAVLNICKVMRIWHSERK